MEDIAEIKAELGLTDGWIRYNASKQRIELPLSIAEDIASGINCSNNNGRGTSNA